MRQFEYTIKHPDGIQAPAVVRLLKTVNDLDSTVTVTKADGKIAPATMFTALLGLNIAQGDKVIVRIYGGNEAANTSIVEQLFKDSL